MDVFLTARRTTVLRLLALAAMLVALLAAGPGTDQAMATVSSKPKGIDAFTEQVLRSAWAYWNAQFTAAGHPGWAFKYLLVKRTETANSPCGAIGDDDMYSNADPSGYCLPNNTIYLSTQWLYDHASNNATTPYGVAYVIAHEVGHAVQAELRLPRHVRVEPEELQADCFSAMWTRHQVDTGAATTKDALDAQHGAQNLGDYAEGDPGHHGTADERVAAWTRGFNAGFSTCLALNPPAGG